MPPRGRPRASRAGLLQAGLDLSAETGLAELTVDAVIDRAGTGKGTFYRHFGDRSGFLLAVHAELQHRVWAAAMDVMNDRVPGLDRLTAATTAYLDACLANRALKAFVTEARADPHVEAAVERDLHAGSDLVAEDLAAIGWSDPPAAARLYMAMAHEIALCEHRSTARAPTLRATLNDIARGHAPRP